MSNKGISKFHDDKNFFLNNEIKLKSQQRFKNEEHNIHTAEMNKIVLRSNVDNRLRNFDRITSNPEKKRCYNI